MDDDGISLDHSRNTTANQRVLPHESTSEDEYARYTANGAAYVRNVRPAALKEVGNVRQHFVRAGTDFYQKENTARFSWKYLFRHDDLCRSGDRGTAPGERHPTLDALCAFAPFPSVMAIRQFIEAHEAGICNGGAEP